VLTRVQVVQAKAAALAVERCRVVAERWIEPQRVDIERLAIPHRKELVARLVRELVELVDAHVVVDRFVLELRAGPRPRGRVRHHRRVGPEDLAEVAVQDVAGTADPDDRRAQRVLRVDP